MIKITRGRLAVRVHTAKSRKLSSTIWLQRQLNDPYVALAKKEGYKSRAAYKLIEIDDKFKFLSPGISVLDLGAKPGGWTQVAVARTKSESNKRSKVISLDMRPMQSIEGSEFIQCDFIEEQSKFVEKYGEQKFHVILSDMAAESCGKKSIDHLRIMALCEEAFRFSLKFLRRGGYLITKVLQGGTEQDMSQMLKKYFNVVKYFKPKSSRKNSSEIYLVAIDFKPEHVAKKFGGLRSSEDAIKNDNSQAGMKQQFVKAEPTT